MNEPLNHFNFTDQELADFFSWYMANYSHHGDDTPTPTPTAQIMIGKLLFRHQQNELRNPPEQAKTSGW